MKPLRSCNVTEFTWVGNWSLVLRYCTVDRYWVWSLCRQPICTVTHDEFQWCEPTPPSSTNLAHLLLGYRKKTCPRPPKQYEQCNLANYRRRGNRYSEMQPPPPQWQSPRQQWVHGSRGDTRSPVDHTRPVWYKRMSAVVVDPGRGGWVVLVGLTNMCEGRKREEEKKKMRDGGFYRSACGQSHTDNSQLGLVVISLFFVLFVSSPDQSKWGLFFLIRTSSIFIWAALNVGPRESLSFCQHFYNNFVSSIFVTSILVFLGCKDMKRVNKTARSRKRSYPPTHISYYILFVQEC